MKNEFWDSISGMGKNITSMSRHTKLGLLEKHTRHCDCSCCTDPAFERKILWRKSPGNKTSNSWWVLFLRVGSSKYYLRYHSLFYRDKR